MPEKHKPRSGSLGYSPRKRARAPVPRIRTWPESDRDQPHLQGFTGYKAGMTHVLMRDYRPTSTTSGQEVQEPVTVVEVPDVVVAGVRAYDRGPYGLKTRGETWADHLPETLERRLPLPEGGDGSGLGSSSGAADVRVLLATRPDRVSGIPTKAPEVVEARIAGGDVQERFDMADELLGQEVAFTEFSDVGRMIDVAAITKGKGFSGSVPRWGVRIQQHKNSKNRRDASPLGPWHPTFVRSTVPQHGQMGYHQRLEYNKRVLKVGEDGSEVTPRGGFKHYGEVRNRYILLHGSIPGPAKRLVRMRQAARYLAGVEVEEPEITYISTESKQGA